MWSKKKRRRALSTIVRFGKPHRRHFVKGLAATFAVVFFRLAMPWPLRGVVESVFPAATDQSGLLVDSLPAWGDPVLWLGGVYVLLALGCGLFEMFQRVNIMKYAAYTVHDMREAAVAGARRRAARRNKSSGDLIARIVGDSARIKAGLSGILVHVLQNGLILLGVCIVLFVISWKLGLIFLIGSLVGIAVGLGSSSSVAETSEQARRKESEYAMALQESLDHGGDELQMAAINESSAQKEVRSTKLIARSSLMVHLAVATTIGCALWFGAKEVAAGSLAPGELFLFVAYALTLHRRTVQIGRQSARSGKLMACTNRLAMLIAKSESSQEDDVSTSSKLEPLVSELRLEEIRLKSGKGREPRIRKADLTIYAGSHVVVLGEIGSGKSSLLELIAGREIPDRGRIFWDDREVTHNIDGLVRKAGYLPQEPVFRPMRVWRILGLSAPDALGPEAEKTLRRIGAWRVIRNLPGGLLAKVGSVSLSRNEARALSLAAIVLGEDADVWVLDSPLEGLPRVSARRRLREILRAAGHRAVVVAGGAAIPVKKFSRVLQLRNGKIRFDGSPDEWKARDGRVEAETVEK